ncbi:MAG TPA: ThuA domain-containing protein [Methylomirabilota bacterium]|nr:ThuA domain-containing protein [Methylomirabilota bacterium]
MKTCAAFCILALTIHVARPAELPARDGLIFRLKASAQAEARQDASLPPIQSFQPVDIALDTSSAGRRAMQAVASRRPEFVSDGKAAYFKFDGQDDFLGFSGAGESAAELTVFVLAAPQSNPGTFSGMFAVSSSGRNDFTSGLNLDFGPTATDRLSVLNVESAGAGGFQDLLEPGFFNAADRPFGDFHVFTVRTKPGEAGTEVFLDGFKGGERDRAESTIGLDQLLIGARYYSNDGNHPPHVQGAFDGAIADVLVYDRALSDGERRAVEQALLAETVALHALLRGAGGHALETVENPPPVQMLVPGFTVEELPLKLRNLNNVRYRHDGTLVALGYDGRIHLLTDSDGDGLEDTSEVYWDRETMRGPIGMALLGKDDPRGEGVIVSSKGKVSLLLDSDRDGRAEEERIVASGWPEGFQNVDTLGVAIDPEDGWIYFGLGCVNFANAYLVDPATGRAGYDIGDIRGTIQRVSPDFSKQETVATGVRFTCALAFNRHGDLFATDQEGATWLPNGNPMDELLHIQPDRHYGFPPRHPRHLPDVIDQPAVIEFGPQHQSTVGLVFNEGVHGGPSFGPAHWEGDALITGQSRGKIWRTRLAKTPLGYVAQNHLIACLGLLTVDACVSPQGDLVVVCHSGPPDWGTGPTGEGRIFKIRHRNRELPQPVLAWAARPDEFRVAFDRPLDPADWADAKDNVRIEAGDYVSAGDRFEVMRPGYQVVRDQMNQPRRWVDVLGLSLSGDRRTLVLRVPRQTERVNYAITLPLPESWRGNDGIPQHPQMDVQVSLNGLAAGVVTADGRELDGVLPHPSLDASATLAAGSAEHEALIAAAKTDGASLALSGLVDVSNPFVPAVQEGSTVDWDQESDEFVMARFGIRSDDSTGKVVDLGGEETSRLKRLEEVVVSHPSLAANGLLLARDELRHPVTTERVFVPWADEVASRQSTELARERTDVKGDWLRGRRLYFGEAGCVTCHTIRGEGMALGPDLSNLIHRDRESVVHDILEPSATINPDQTGTMVTLENGTVLTGIARSLGADPLVIALAAGEKLEIPRAQVKTVEAMETSLMPAGLGAEWSDDQMEDLLTFLLINPLEPAPITRTDPPAPPARGRDEVMRVLGSIPTAGAGGAGPLRILLCAGPKDHGPDEHDYPLWLERWSRLLALGDNVVVTTAMGFPTAEQLEGADVAVFYNANPGWSPARAELLDAFHERGGGAVYIHYAVNGGEEPDAVAERAGLAFTFGSRFRHGEFDLVFTRPDHPITRGFPTLHFTDETYWNMRGDVSRLEVLGTSVEDNAPRPELWTLERGRGRIVGCIPGHFTWTFDDPLFRVLVFRGICWAAKQENPDRLAELSFIGAWVRP